MPSKRNITIYKVAERVGVSIATISRALNPETRGKVAPETLERINIAVRRSGYTPSIAARNLSTDLYKSLGIIFPHHHGMLLSDYYTRLLSGVADYLLESDYRLKMVLLKPGYFPWDHYNFKNGEGIDGMILTYWRSVFSNTSALKRLPFPCIIVNNVEPGIPAGFVAGDHAEGGRIAAEHLWNLGHRKIAVVGGKKGAPDARERLDGFMNFLKSKGISRNQVPFFDVNFEEQKAYEVTAELIRLRPRPTAVFCMNDTQAYGVLRRLRDLKVRCPLEVSVMGYDNENRAAQMEPSLTSVEVPVYELGRKAAERLLLRLKNKMPSKEFLKTLRLPPVLVTRSSTGKRG